MLARINLFVAWYLLLQAFLNNVLAELGTLVLSVLGMPDPMPDKLGWLVGALLLLALLLVVQVYFRELPPGLGRPGGKGYRLGHGLVLGSSAFSLGVYVLPFFIHHIADTVIATAVAKVVIGMLYPALGMFGFGLSFIYQSALPVDAKNE